MGLREDKQRLQRQLIIENTVALLRRPPEDAVRVRDIAARCGVSDATFFNYFASQDAVLREWLEDLVDDAFARAAARHDTGSGLRRALRGVADDLGRLAAAEGPLLVRALDGTRPLRSSESAEPSRGRVARPACDRQLIEAARTRGEIRADAEVEQLADMLRAVVLAALARAAMVARAHDAGASGASDVEAAVSARIRGAVDVLLDALRKRNERVRAPARATAAATAPAGS